MRKVRDLMKDLGFREEGSEEVKAAFIKNLIRAAQGSQLAPEPRRSQVKRSRNQAAARSARSADRKSKRQAGSSTVAQGQVGEQLSFDLGSEDPAVSSRRKRLG